MRNYLQHIIKQNLWFRSPRPVATFSCDERFIKYTRKVVYTWVDVYIDLKKAPSVTRGAFFMVFIEIEI